MTAYNDRRHRRRLARVRHHRALPPIRIELPPRDITAYVAYIRSLRPAWEAARFGDRDPQVMALASIYRDWTGEPA